MEKMDDKMTCEVVQDLLPLYVDGACTEGSRRLVEEHVKTCESCKKQLGEMGRPIEALLAEPEQEKTETERMLAEALKKMRRNYKRVIAICLAVLLAIPLGTLFYREMTGEGLCISNYAEYRRSKEVLTLWMEEGSARAVEAMSPLALYEDRACAMEDFKIYRTYAMPNSFGGDYSRGQFGTVELLGETYYFPGEVYWQEKQLTTKAQLDQQQLYQAGDELGVLHSLMKDNPEGIIVSERVFQSVQAKFGDLEQENYYTLKRDNGTYYYYVDPGNYDSPDGSLDLNEYFRIYAPEYEPELYEVLGELEPIDPEYWILVRWGTILPEPLWQEYEQTYETIYANYQAYADYYSEMGYETFAADYRAELEGLLGELETLGLTVTDAQLFCMGNSVFYPGQGGIYVRWRLTAGDYWLFAGFYVQKNGNTGYVCHLDSLMSYNAPEEVQSILKQINHFCAGGY